MELVEHTFHRRGHDFRKRGKTQGGSTGGFERRSRTHPDMSQDSFKKVKPFPILRAGRGTGGAEPGDSNEDCKTRKGREERGRVDGFEKGAP